MNYKEARNYMNEVQKVGSVLGLESIRGLLDQLGHPEDYCKIIHIAGTNGKGSVLAYLSHILQASGYRVGRYISPTLFHYRERIQVNQKEISKESYAKHVTTIASAIEQLKLAGRPVPTAFEIETALSFLYYKEMDCDLVVLETGLGGTLDATNIVKTTILEVITAISMDHMEQLGKTIEAIASQKAGIIKPHTRVVSAPQDKEVLAVLKQKALAEESTFESIDYKDVTNIAYGLEKQTFDYKWSSDNSYKGAIQELKNLEITLAGTYQIYNAALAVLACKNLIHLGYHISIEHIYKGLKETQWKGRFTPILKKPLFIIDGAHNEAAALELKKSIKLYLKDRDLYFIMGMLKDKDIQAVTSITAPLAKEIRTITPPNNERGLSGEELRKYAVRYNDHVKAVSTIKRAVEESLERISENGVIIAFGSLSFLGEIVACVESKEK